jgi:hypothetical protein
MDNDNNTRALVLCRCLILFHKELKMSLALVRVEFEIVYSVSDLL